MDDPIVPNVDPHVPDLAGARARAPRAEEDDVTRLQQVTSEPRRTEDLAAHLVARPPAENLRKRRPPDERLELVDPPYESGAVESARHQLAEEQLRSLRRARPDIRRADESDRTSEHDALPLGQVREREALCSHSNSLDRRVVQRQHSRDRKRSLGASRGLRELELELLLNPLVIDPQPEQPRDRLGTEPRFRSEPRIAR